jgi:hypothetical protein
MSSVGLDVSVQPTVAIAPSPAARAIREYLASRISLDMWKSPPRSVVLPVRVRKVVVVY